MKKLSLLLASLALALCLTGCNNSQTSGSGISTPSLIQNGSSSTSSSSSTSTSSTTSTTSQSSTSTSSSEMSSSSEESSVSESTSESSKSTPESTAPIESTTPEQSSTAPAEDKTLVVYFTWSSNTAGMAETIADLTGADTFEIVPVIAYPAEYTPCTEVALEERDNNARPAIQNLPASVSEYDNIIIGYPIWWHTAPMIIGTFLENYDLSGIDVYPFTQSASMNAEQFEQSMEFVRGCAGNATVHDGLFARPSDTAAITSYLEQNGLTK